MWIVKVCLSSSAESYVGYAATHHSNDVEATVLRSKYPHCVHINYILGVCRDVMRQYKETHLFAYKYTRRYESFNIVCISTRMPYYIYTHIQSNLLTIDWVDSCNRGIYMFYNMYPPPCDGQQVNSCAASRK